MPRITGLSIGGLSIPLNETDDAPFIVTHVSGISDLTYKCVKTGYEEVYINGGGRDIAIVLTIHPTQDYHAVRRLISRAMPLDSEIMVVVFLDDDPYAQVLCKVRNVSFDFSEESPTAALDLESVYTCLSLYDSVEVHGLPFGVNAQLPTVTHDYTPVQVIISLVSPMAMWYRIYVSSDWLTIYTSVLRTNYGINGVPEGSTIEIDSDAKNFHVTLRRPGFDDENIETACDVGKAGFQFMPNEPMLVQTAKLPSGLSGEQVTLTCNPRLSGV